MRSARRSQPKKKGGEHRVCVCVGTTLCGSSLRSIKKKAQSIDPLSGKSQRSIRDNLSTPFGSIRHNLSSPFLEPWFQFGSNLLETVPPPCCAVRPCRGIIESGSNGFQLSKENNKVIFQRSEATDLAVHLSRELASRHRQANELASCQGAERPQVKGVGV